MDEEKLYDIRQNVGMVFQNPDNQIVATIVEEDVAFALENWALSRKKSAEEWMKRSKPLGCMNTVDMLPISFPEDKNKGVAIAGIMQCVHNALCSTSRLQCLIQEGVKSSTDDS